MFGLLSLAQAALGSSALTQTSLLGLASGPDPVLVGLNSANFEVSVVCPGGQTYPVWKPHYPRRALCELPGNHVLVAGPSNELFILDAMAADTP